MMMSRYLISNSITRLPEFIDYYQNLKPRQIWSCPLSDNRIKEQTTPGYTAQ